jgi:hypothetical protein
VKNSTSYIYPSGSAQGAPAYAAISASSNGANTIVAAKTGYIIQVLQYVLAAAGTVTGTWESSGGALLSGAMPFVANGSLAPPFNPVGHFQTVKGEGLVLFLSSGVLVTGHLIYILI